MAGVEKLVAGETWVITFCSVARITDLDVKEAHGNSEIATPNTIVATGNTTDQKYCINPKMSEILKLLPS